ncbi:Ribosomal RNA large subunit methyltransferase E [Candida viswanathii]|uniref:rRNA methyltransferase 2, mitochondrial n=1 Tax=Candida viswanathii TaxID=5486 RepID=A0A367YJU0_9ASCO|nr:Ribosomal RNA large subunit methyltransferase E [Candida viswanathii]
MRPTRLPMTHTSLHLRRFKSDKRINSFLNRVQGDSFVSERKTSLYKSRAAFKLLEIDAAHRLFNKNTRNIADLGFAPGAWTQVAVQRLEAQKVAYNILGVDINPASPVRGCHYIQGDVTKKSTHARIVEFFKNRDERDKVESAGDGQHLDFIMSDMMVNAMGSGLSDHDGNMYLCSAALLLAYNQLKPGCNILLKVWLGQELEEFVDRMKLMFAHVNTIKPKASRSILSELYVLGKKKYDMKERGVTIEQLFG